MKRIEKKLKKSAKLLPSMQKEIVFPDGIELLKKIHKNIFYKVALAALSLGICFGITLSVGAQVSDKVATFFKDVVKTESTLTEQSSESETSSEITVESAAPKEPISSEEQTSSKEQTTSQQQTTLNQSAPPQSAIEEEFEHTPLGEMKKGVGYYIYELDGTITDWFVEDEVVHTIFKNDNRYIVFDTVSGEIIFNYELIGRPAEIHNINNELWISYPDLQCIKIYDKQTFSIKNTISLQHRVSSFDVYGDYIIYTENKQRVIGYRYNLNNGQTDVIEPDFGQVILSESDVLVNQKFGFVYISESDSTASKLYCYDIETLELKSKTPQHQYGYVNFVRRSFLVDDYLYWNAYEIDSTDVSKIRAQYVQTYVTGMLYADEQYVVTTEGIYLRKTYEQIVSGDFDEYNSAVAITTSGNVFISEIGKLYIFSNDNLESQGIF